MNAREVLKDVFGYDNFREGQDRLVDAVCSGRDVLGIMPTGAGKSICFQVPALMADGITLVISPLISLMRDQVAALNAAGIHAAYLNSSLTPGQYAKAIAFAKTGRYKLIYVAPERLDTERFLDFALDANVKIPFIAVDEAHCVSQWGQDFRPSYLKIADFVRRLPHRPIVGAYTATATSQVKEDIQKLLELKDPVGVTTGFDRDNLYFAVKKPRDKYMALKYYLQDKEEAMSGASGIIYCLTRKNVNEVAERLEKDGFSVTRYHAGLDEAERHANQEEFISGNKQFMVATNAFGMGIDKSDVRFVVHYNMPKDMESYYQEAGRAGRDGDMAECILLYGKNDVRLNDFLIEHSSDDNEELSDDERAEIKARDKERLKKMTFYCHTKYCLRSYILNYFGEKGPKNCGNCSVCLKERDESKEFVLDIPDNIGSDLAERPVNVPSEYKISKSRKKSVSESLEEGDRRIFDALRALRTTIAKETRVHPYIIFSDRTLAYMAVSRPKTKEEMLKVSGVGQFKYEKYGERFLETIRNSSYS